jgi:hypothetical protein
MAIDFLLLMRKSVVHFRIGGRLTAPRTARSCRSTRTAGHMAVGVAFFGTSAPTLSRVSWPAFSSCDFRPGGDARNLRPPHVCLSTDLEVQC